LFVYAAASKLLDFENFKVQIGQSPILGAFAGVLAWLVPSLEIIFSICLWIPRLRSAALFCCYTLMLMFTGYIFIVLNYSSFVPCSCGGVLEHMDWTTHLYFNLLFVILATTAILLSPASTPLPWLKKLKWLSLSSLGGLVIITGLHLLSDNIVQEHNTFIRRFPFSPAKVHEADLGYNSYYIAGCSGQGIFLGNYTVPLLLEEFDHNLKKRESHRIKVDTMYANSTLHLYVDDKEFYITDGNIPIIYKGKMSGNWKAKKIWNGKFPFTHIRFTDSAHAAVRTYTKEGQSVLAAIAFSSPNATLKEGLLQRQVDGVFDVDGILLYDSKAGEIVYAHSYKNQLIIADKDLNLKRRNTTIDTVSKAKIRVAKLKKRGDRLLSAPPLTVNHTAAADNGYIFVHSGLMGRFESKLMWKEASIIDVYASKSNRYLFSFYVHHIDGKKLRSFIVKKNHLYGLIGNHLVDYQLHDAMFNAKKVEDIQAVSGKSRKPVKE
jgi:uncharacterized membrane protein YphA (DoxX/SURF4 family)